MAEQRGHAIDEPTNKRLTKEQIRVETPAIESTNSVFAFFAPVSGFGQESKPVHEFNLYMVKPLTIASQGLRAKQRDFYQSTKKRSHSDLAVSLHENTEAFDRIVHPASFTAGTHDITIKSSLADRRVAKIYEHLKGLSPQKAEILARANFAVAFERYKSLWDTSDILPCCEHYSVEAHLFLCSEFCKPEVVLQKMDDWNDWHEEKMAKGNNFQFNTIANINKPYAINLLMNMVMRSYKWSIDEMNQWLSTTFGPDFANSGDRPPSLTLAPMKTFDWGMVDREPLAQIPVLTGYSALEHAFRQGPVLKRLRSALQPKGL